MSLPVFEAALAAVQAGTGDCKIACIGDSTTGGLGGTLSATFAYRSSWPEKICALASSPSLPFSSSAPGPSTPALPNNEWSFGGGWTFDGLGFLTAQESASAGDVTYAPNTNSDTYDVYYVTVGGSGTLLATATGGTPVSINTAGATGIGKTTITAGSAATTNVVTISWVSGTVYLVAIHPRLAATKQVLMANFGVGGSRATTWATAGAFYALGSLQVFAPALTVIMLGINDAGVGQDAATVKAAIASIATTAKLSGDVVFMSIVPSNGSPIYEVEQTYYSMGQQLADEFDGVFIDIWTSFGGSFNAPLMSDDLHPKNAGYDLMAGVIQPILFPPAPSGNALLGGGFF